MIKLAQLVEKVETERARKKAHPLMSSKEFRIAERTTAMSKAREAVGWVKSRVQRLQRRLDLLPDRSEESNFGSLMMTPACRHQPTSGVGQRGDFYFRLGMII